MVCAWKKVAVAKTSPSMRREWIEIFLRYYFCSVGLVSLHAEGVD